jgi:class 3 adenylate cyclase/tetratricopeptide (TPR) repeat protein
MKCPRCQTDTDAGARFCEDCGARLEAACPSCGTPITPGKKFCRSCGAALTTEPAGRFASPESYTPKHLAEKILTSKNALEGERKQVTVLFADLKGSMELLADRDPEEARKLLDPVLERMMDAVHRYEGTVNQVMGDGIMALFGAPVAHEDHAVRACYAALDMQAAIRRYADEVWRAHGITAQIRVGLNSGEVVVRALGSDLHMDYTAVGQTTHLAARLEQLASPGSSLMTADTLRLAEGYIEVKPRGPVPVKGLDSPIEVYEVLGAGPVRSRLHAAAARGLTRFVGRDTELQQLAQALERAAAGHGQAVAVVGEAGVGKSRLVWEFMRSHRTHGWPVLESGSVSYGKATPYLPVIELLKAYCRIQERDDPRAIRERVAGKLLMLDRALEPLLTPLLALLDVPVDDAAWDALDPPQRRQRTLEAVKRLLLRESQVQPLLVIFEDLHWIDAETQALLDGLIESLPTACVLLLVNYRPEYQHAWGRKTYYLQLRIDPLPPASAEELLTALLGEDRTLEPLKRALIERTEGNPFFLEESVRTLVETQVLVGERGAYRMAKAPEAWQIPATAQAILAARIDRLAADDKRLLQAASVIGKDVPLALLQAIADIPEEGLSRGLAHLQAAEFLYETSLFPDLEYTFKHALTHEVAYGGVLQERRRALHARIVEAIERLYPDRLSEHIERLAHHAFRGERWETAVVYLRQAGAKALARSANREAAVCFEHALAALAHLPETPAGLRQAIDIRFEVRNALWILGEHVRILSHLRDAERLLTSIGDRHRMAQLASYLANSYLVLGEPHRVVEWGERALTLAAELNDASMSLIGTFRVGQGYHTIGDYRQAIEFFRRAAASLGDDPTRRYPGIAGVPSAFFQAYLAWCLAEVGDFAEGVVAGENGIHVAEAVEHPYTLTFAALCLGVVYVRKGDLPRAVAVLERGLQVAKDRSVPVFLPFMGSYLGTAYTLSGRQAEGRQLLEQALDQATASRLVLFQALRTASLAESHLAEGRVTEAIALAKQAAKLAAQHGERGSEAWALRLLGEVAFKGGNIGAVTEHYREALALATELGMRPLVAHCHLGLGKLYRRTGDRAKAEEHLTTASALYREMDMGFWLAQAEGRLAT